MCVCVLWVAGWLAAAQSECVLTDQAASWDQDAATEKLFLRLTVSAVASEVTSQSCLACCCWLPAPMSLSLMITVGSCLL